MPRPSAQGAVTYTTDGRFHCITVRTEVPISDAERSRARPSPEEAMAVASGVVAYAGTYRVDESTKTALTLDRDEFGSEFRRSAQSAPDRHVDYRRGTEAHEPAHACRCDTGVGVQAGKVTSLPCYRPRRDDDVMPSAIGRLSAPDQRAVNQSASSRQRISFAAPAVYPMLSLSRWRHSGPCPYLSLCEACVCSQCCRMGSGVHLLWTNAPLTPAASPCC